MCDTRLKGYSGYSPFEQRKSGKEDNGGELPMAEEKKGLFVRLFGGQKKGNCCSMKIEEIPEEEGDETPRQVSPLRRGSACCGPAPDARDISGRPS